MKYVPNNFFTKKNFKKRLTKLKLKKHIYIKKYTYIFTKNSFILKEKQINYIIAKLNKSIKKKKISKKKY